MQHETRRLDPYDTNTGTGILGRMTDVLTSKGHNTGSFSVDRFSVAVVGEPGVTEAPMIINRDGLPELYLDATTDAILGKLHNTSSANSGIFAETWSASLIDGIGTNKLFSSELKNTTTNGTFPDTNLGKSLETISKVIATRDVRGVDVDTFYVGLSGLSFLQSYQIPFCILYTVYLI